MLIDSLMHRDKRRYIVLSLPRVCQSDGHWTGEQPECLEVFCEDPVSISNAVFDFKDTRVL